MLFMLIWLTQMHSDCIKTFIKAKELMIGNKLASNNNRFVVKISLEPDWHKKVK